MRRNGWGERRGVSPTWERTHVGLTPRRSPVRTHVGLTLRRSPASTSGLRRAARQLPLLFLFHHWQQNPGSVLRQRGRERHDGVRTADAEGLEQRVEDVALFLVGDELGEVAAELLQRLFALDGQASGEVVGLAGRLEDDLDLLAAAQCAR